MSWHFSRALEEEYSAACSSDGKPSVPWKSILTAPASLCSGKMKATFQRFPFGTMYVPSEGGSGAALLTWFLGVFPVSLSAPQLTANQLQLISGPKCEELSEKPNPPASSPKMYPEKLLKPLPEIAKNSDTKQKFSGYPRKTWVLTTFGNDTGYLHTPTCAMNFAAESMQKHPNCRIFVRVFGRPDPTNQEWLMGWPIGWTDSKPLEMDKFRRWLRQHGVSLRRG